MKKETYEDLQIKVIVFACEDILTTSPPMGEAGVQTPEYEP